MNPSQSGWSLAAEISFTDKTYKPHLLEKTKLKTKEGTNISSPKALLKMIFPFPKVEYVSSVEGRC